MKQTLLLAIACLFSLLSDAQTTIFQNNRGNTDSYISEWVPFYHGVASGDPLSDRVIIWTRVTPDSSNTEDIDVYWLMATDTAFDNVVAEGIFNTNADRDYTVKVDVEGLDPNTTYYYVFNALDRYSLIGRTKTAPLSDEADHLKFGVVSCSNYQAGYFNGYQRLAERNDLDAIIHLGDYIYEYADQVYGDDNLWEDRVLSPETEIVSLEDYRIRYSTYRLDTQLVRAHQQHPFIAVWDDHESANDAYTDGAENHDPGSQGPWTERLANARKVYFEWMPIRENDDESIYRTISYGDLCDLIMIDTRIEGRNEQILDITNPALYAPERTILGEAQKEWFLGQLSDSDARWKIIGNQVIFSEFNVGWAADTSQGQDYAAVENIFLDIWDGYPAERDTVINHIVNNNIDNTVFLTGDFHSSFAYDVALRPSALPFLVGINQIPPTYDGDTQTGSVAVEFATPSITSANFDENVGDFAAAFFEAQINQPLPGIGVNPNPHMRLVDLDQHGYFVLDIKADSVQADYFFSDIASIVQDESHGGSQYVRDGENQLNPASTPSGPKAIQPIPAPKDPLRIPTSIDDTRTEDITTIISCYPNPAFDSIKVQYGVQKSGTVTLDIYDAMGSRVASVYEGKLNKGIYAAQFDVSLLPTGTYYLQVSVNGTLGSTFKWLKK